jgi:Tuberculosis necrotizing toxin
VTNCRRRVISQKFSRFLALTLALAAFPAVGDALAQTPGSQACPATIRADLMPKWLTCAEGKATVNWPPNEGFDVAPVAATLPKGALIDRFGSEGGTFFSPAGQSFDARAVPYVCKAMDYRVYRVTKDLDVKMGKAAPWFDEPGGAIQYETGDPAYKLRDGGYLELVRDDLVGSGKPAPQCGRP